MTHFRFEEKANKSPLPSDILGCCKNSTAHGVKERVLSYIHSGRYFPSHRKETADVLCTNQPLAYVCHVYEGKMLPDILFYLSRQIMLWAKRFIIYNNYFVRKYVGAGTIGNLAMCLAKKGVNYRNKRLHLNVNAHTVSFTEND